jgi:hypothetical protein
MVIMIAHQSSVDSLYSLGIVNPFTSLSQNFILLQVIISSNYFLKARRRILNLLYDCELDVAIPHYICVSIIFLFAFRRSLFMLIPWFIKVDFIRHDDGLDRE